MNRVGISRDLGVPWIFSGYSQDLSDLRLEDRFLSPLEACMSRARTATVLSIAGVLLAGASAFAVNVQVLDAASSANSIAANKPSLHMAGGSGANSDSDVVAAAPSETTKRRKDGGVRGNAVPACAPGACEQTRVTPNGSVVLNRKPGQSAGGSGSGGQSSQGSSGNASSGNASSGNSGSGNASSGDSGPGDDSNAEDSDDSIDDVSDDHVDEVEEDSRDD